jgi:hypothetical protein
MSAYYGQPIKYFTDEISENQFVMLTECMDEVLTQGERVPGQDFNRPDLEAFKKYYGNNREVHR